MQRNDISLSDEELEAIWKGALQNKHDFNGFLTLFSEGLYKGIQKIQDNKEVVREALYLATKNGDFDKFKRLFETGIVQVNEYHDGKTFLHTVIKNDTQSENDLTTIGRKKIAKYLLDNGADMDLRSSGLADDKPSPWEMWNLQKPDIANYLFAKNFEIHYSVHVLNDINEFKALLNHWFTGIPDLKHTIDDYIVEGNKVVARWHGEGTHQGKFIDISPTGKTFYYGGITILELLSDGKIIKAWVYNDLTDSLSKLKGIK